MELLHKCNGIIKETIGEGDTKNNFKCIKSQANRCRLDAQDFPAIHQIIIFDDDKYTDTYSKEKQQIKDIYFIEVHVPKIHDRDDV